MNQPSERDILIYFALKKFDAIVDIVASMDDDTANTSLPVAGSNSPYALLTHCVGAMRRWSSTVNRGITIPRDRDAEFVATGAVSELIEEARSQREAFIDDLHEVDLDAAPIAPPERQGEDLERKYEVVDARAVILHIIEELAQHLGHLEITRDMLAYFATSSPGTAQP